LTNCEVKNGGAGVQTRGVLTSLRLMRPARRLTRIEARRVAERQAARLLRLRGGLDAPIAEEVISHLYRIEVYRADLGTLSGVSHWDGVCWRITVNSRHAATRQRFTIGHEFAHIVDAPYQRVVRPEYAEEIADYFATSLLMPKRLVKRLWGAGIQDTPTLARHFNVSVAAMRWRLDELHLGDIADVPRLRGRCGGVVSERELHALIGDGGSHEYQLAN
jgi:predicted transcriptional regulator